MSAFMVLFGWEISEASRAYITAATKEFDLRLVFPEDSSEEQLIALIPDADLFVGPRASAALLDAAERLRLFIVPWAGVQHCIKAFQERSPDRFIPLANAHGNAPLTAQHAVALLLSLCNKIVPHHRWMLEGRWRTGDEDAASIPLRGRHLGFLGYGAVNRQVHRYLAGFGLAASALRTRWPDDPEDGPPLVERYRPDGLRSFLESVDTLFLALPMTGETRGLVGEKELEALGPDGLIVHLARGPIIDEDALYQALAEKRIRGAAIDVWYEYRPKPDEAGAHRPYHRPFHELDNVVLSPHRAASPFDDLERWDDIIDNIRRLCVGEPFTNLVDVDRGY